MKTDKKLVGLFMGLVLLIVSSLSISFAWFNSGTDLHIEEFDLVIDTDVDLFISSKPDINEIKEGIHANDLVASDYLIPVSSSYSSEWIGMKKEIPMFTAHYHNDGKNNVRPGYAFEGFFQKELYLYATESQIVTLNSNETYFTANEILNKETAKKLADTYPQLSEEQILANLNDVTKSLRISVLVPDEDDYSYFTVKNETLANETETYFGGILDNDGDGYYDYHFDNQGEKYETLFGEFNYVSGASTELDYLPKSAIDSTTDGQLTCFNAKTQAGVYHLDTSSLSNKVEFAKENALCIDEADARIDNGNPGMQINLQSQKFKKIVVSFYLEGWDLDNTIVTCFANFGIKLGFTTYRITPTIAPKEGGK